MTALTRALRSRSAAIAAIAIGASAIAAGSALAGSRAWGAFEQIVDDGTRGHLTLAVDDSTQLRATLQPGERTRWLIEARLSDADRGSLALELHADGALVDRFGLTVSVDACAGSFESAYATQPTCTGEAAAIVSQAPLRDVVSTTHSSHRYRLADLVAGDPRQLLVTLALPADSEVPSKASATIGLGLHAQGDDAGGALAPITPDTPSAGSLPLTGSGLDTLTITLLAAGIGSAAFGATMLRRTRKQP